LLLKPGAARPSGQQGAKPSRIHKDQKTRLARIHVWFRKQRGLAGQYGAQQELGYARPDMKNARQEVAGRPRVYDAPNCGVGPAKSLV